MGLEGRTIPRLKAEYSTDGLHQAIKLKENLRWAGARVWLLALLELLAGATVASNKCAMPSILDLTDDTMNHILSFIVMENLFWAVNFFLTCKYISGLTRASLNVAKANEAKTWKSLADCIKNHRPVTRATLARKMEAFPLKPSLCVAFMSIREEDGSVFAIADGIAGSSVVSHLDVSYNLIGSKGAIALIRAAKSSVLISLNLSHNSISGSGGEAIADFVKSSNTLKRLNLAYNSLGSLGVLAIASALGPNGTNPNGNTSVTDLNLSANFHGESIEKLCDALKHNKTLTSLSLSKNGLGDGGAHLLGDLLSANTTLKSLIVIDNHITSFGASMLGAAMKENVTSLSLLNLSCNMIDSAGVETLTHGMQFNTSLETLILNENSQIGASGVRRLAHFLCKQDGRLSLKVLKIRYVCAPVGDLISLRWAASRAGVDLETD